MYVLHCVQKRQVYCFHYQTDNNTSLKKGRIRRNIYAILVKAAELDLSWNWFGA